MENKNIDKIFNEAFNGWEAEASPLEMQADWSRLSQALPQVPVNTPVAPKPLWSAGKILGWVATGAVVTTVGILTYNALTKNASNTIVEKTPQQIEITVPENKNIIVENNSLPGETADKDIWAGDTKIDIKVNTGNNNNRPKSGDVKTELPWSKKENPYKADDKNASGINNNVKNDGIVTPQPEKPGTQNRFNKNSIIYSDTIFCLGNELNVKYNEASIAENVVVVWGDGKKEIFNGNANHIYASSGKYLVKFLANNREVTSKIIYVEDKPSASFTIRECEGLKCKFRNASKNGYIYTWNFGDGTQPDRSMNPEHAFNDTGEYKVTLTAYSRGNCENVYTQNVRVREFNAPIIYTKITPNGDGYNDKFTIIFKEEVSYFELTVVDRSGAKVFETKDPGQSWNGTMFNMGAACADGSYFYLLSYKYAADGKLKQEQGAVHLSR